jgi:prepilin-type N-terminal cleavage/methylation domain-containing protein
MAPMRTKGFTLIEAAVALAILAVTLTVIYPVFGGTLRHAADQRHRDQAWLAAQSLLEEMRADGSLPVGHRIGRTAGGLMWETEVRSTHAAPTALAVAALEVAVKVKWGERPSDHIELHSIELGAAR